MRALREYKQEIKSKYGRMWKTHWDVLFNRFMTNKQLITINGIVYVKE